MKIKLILDLDGVLITTPNWKPDEMDFDNYSKFNPICVRNLNTLLEQFDFEIWLISTRRTVKTIEEFNSIFNNRKIVQEIKGFVPKYVNSKNRKEEVVMFIEEFQLKEYLILDDDKSLNGLDITIKEKFVCTEYMKGFNEEKLKEATQIINTMPNKL